MHQIRRFDDLGRIAIPKEIREAVTHVKNTEGVQMEVYVDDGAIVLKSHKPKDMVEVVRCKDCKHYEETYPGYGYCYHWDYEDGSSPNEVQSDDFCSSGAKMDGGDKR